MLGDDVNDIDYKSFTFFINIKKTQLKNSIHILFFLFS